MRRAGRDKLSSSIAISGFVATFVDGPLAAPEHDRHFSVGAPSAELYFAPLEHGKLGWALVGMGGELKPHVPWPGQVCYRLGQTLEGRSPRGETVAFYRLERD
jgi:hypothetical protein